MKYQSSFLTIFMFGLSLASTHKVIRNPVGVNKNVENPTRQSGTDNDASYMVTHPVSAATSSAINANTDEIVPSNSVQNVAGGTVNSDPYGYQKLMNAWAIKQPDTLGTYLRACVGAACGAIRTAAYRAGTGAVGGAIGERLIQGSAATGQGAFFGAASGTFSGAIEGAIRGGLARDSFVQHYESLPPVKYVTEKTDHVKKLNYKALAIGKYAVRKCIDAACRMASGAKNIIAANSLTNSGNEASSNNRADIENQLPPRYSSTSSSAGAVSGAIEKIEVTSPARRMPLPSSISYPTSGASPQGASTSSATKPSSGLLHSFPSTQKPKTLAQIGARESIGTRNSPKKRRTSRSPSVRSSKKGVLQTAGIGKRTERSPSQIVPNKPNKKIKKPNRPVSNTSMKNMPRRATNAR